jgi:sirohydrochlorin ferrochelatase
VRALVLVGHGSLRKASGAAMIRLAALARETGLSPIATAGFLNFSKPTFADAVARCVRKGATDLLVQPYFLIPGYYVSEALPKLVAEAQRRHPTLMIRVAEAFGYHPALVDLVQDRVMKATSHPAGAALLLMAHGTPTPEANAPIEAVAQTLRKQGSYAEVVLSYMEINKPSIPEAIQRLTEQNYTRIIAVPYFLQLGGHVAEDLPREIDEARAKHPQAQIMLTDYLSYDPLILNVIKDRVKPLMQPAVNR